MFLFFFNKIYILKLHFFTVAVLSGKELFSFNSALFVDDDAAIDRDEEEQLNAQTRLAAEEEEARMVFESERARAEQSRLEEVARIEEEERIRVQEERRRLASFAKDVFVLGNIVINQIIFDVEEYEDLIPFAEDDRMEGSNIIGDEVSDDDGDDDNDDDRGEDGDVNGEYDREGGDSWETPSNMETSVVV